MEGGRRGEGRVGKGDDRGRIGEIVAVIMEGLTA